MKLTKILSISAILLAGLMLTGCQNEPGSGGTSGNNPTGIKAEDVIRVSKDGKTVNINYTNNTDEEQIFSVYKDNNLGYDFTGKFTFYDPGEKCDCRFGMLFDYRFGELGDAYADVIEYNFLSRNNNDSINYFVYLARAQIGKEDLTKFNYLSVNDANYFKTINTYWKFKVNDQYLNNKFTINSSEDNIYIEGDDFNTFSFNHKTSSFTQNCYYLIIPAGSSCRLTFEIF